MPLWEGMAFDILYIRVNAISTLTIDNTELKRFQVTFSYNAEFTQTREGDIIEDIGNTENFFHEVETGWCDAIHTVGLRCFQSSTVGEYTLIGEDEDCEIHSTAVDEFDLKDDLNVFPNPGVSSINITGFKNEKSIHWSLIDMQGQLKVNGQSKVAIDGNLTISLNGLNPSVYFLVLKNEKNTIIYRERIVKI